MLFYSVDPLTMHWHVEDDHGALCRGTVHGNAILSLRRIAVANDWDILGFLGKAEFPCRVCWERLEYREQNRLDVEEVNHYTYGGK